MKSQFALCLLATVTIFGANVALANHHEGGEGHGNTDQYKQSADANNDGKLTYEEYKLHNENRYKKSFEHMDANKDGTLDEAELKAIHEMGSGCDHHKMNKTPAANKT
jgi:hypothetical protein